MCLHYVTFMGRNIENRKKLTRYEIMNHASLISKNIVNSVGIFNDGAPMNSNSKGQYWDEQCFLHIFLG